MQAWLTVLDKLPPRGIVIFTTTEDSADLFGQYDGPFRSRCKTIPFTNQGLAPSFATLAKRIAEAEGMDGKPEAAYLRLVLNVMGSVAQWERETIAERTADALAHLRANGKRVSRFAQFGYRLTWTGNANPTLASKKRRS